MSPTLSRHLTAIRAGAVTRSNIIGIRKALNAANRAASGWLVSSTAPILTAAEADELENAITLHHPTATGELHAGGLKVLRNPRYAKRFNAAQRAVIDSEHVRFDLVRFDRIGNGGQTVPVYRVQAFAGAFTFRNIPWQTAFSMNLPDGPHVLADDATFIGSSFGGGWLIPLGGEVTRDLRYYFGEHDAPIDPLGGKRGWIVEPSDVEPVLMHLRDSGYQVGVE